ncbi:phosphoglycerate kinase [bacterium DOLJORAL78_65_58]|nr:MAG: phosphoglycerate kinase [bacterium DOLJORAL78_65_58]
MTKKKGLRDFQPEGRKVLMRVDFNVPLDAERNGSLVLMSHLGRPKGKVDSAYSLRPVADRLAELMDEPVKFASDTVGPDAREKAAGLQPGEILLLENLRFNAGETGNDAEFAAGLAVLADTYVNDAFGTAHRAHASTEGVTHHFETCRAGFLMEKELESMGALLTKPQRPFVAILGGAKVAGKVEVILNLLDKVDTLLLGGGMIFTFFKSHGLGIGSSLLDTDSLDVVKEITARAKDSRAELILPTDCTVATEFNNQAERKDVMVTDIPADWMGLDIGPASAQRYREVILGAKTIFWNGPMGVFELPNFAAGTRAVAAAVAEATDGGAFSVIGGGDSVAAANQFGVGERISHISTGGGASLELMGGRELPGVAALSDA